LKWREPALHRAREAGNVFPKDLPISLKYITEQYIVRKMGQFPEVLLETGFSSRGGGDCGRKRDKDPFG
jgi:hypothetical protein